MFKIFVAGTAGGLWALSYHFDAVLESEIPYLRQALSDAQSCASTASEERRMVQFTEKEIFQQIASAAQDNLDLIECQRRRYRLSKMILPLGSAKERFQRDLWYIWFNNDGDFYESVDEYYSKH